MASFHSNRPSRAARQTGTDDAPVDVPDELLGPIIAGAYARGVAETLDMLGLPGLFLDRSGEVIFASRAATPLLRGPLRLHMRHLVAERAEDNRVLEAFIADAVGEGAEPEAARLPGAAIALRRLPRTAASALPGQRVRAMLLLAAEPDGVQAATSDY